MDRYLSRHEYDMGIIRVQPGSSSFIVICRWDLDFDVIPSPYGEPLDYERLEETANSGGYGWMWAVHGETSTGVLNDLDRLKQISSRHGLLLALDCVSSFGAVPFQLVRPRL
ncbi:MULTISPECIES: hypothetical protein [Paenibacillus]|uniref:hypothetical protein n=2 Tax=Paenibacillus TaxID=44249 RepID=UPI0015873092|nr:MULTISPECIES: hypothetical protein [Paenibacillus]